MKRALAAAALVALCATAHAKFWDGNSLHSHLNGNSSEQILAVDHAHLLKEGMR